MLSIASRPPLLTIPNFSEGSNAETIAAIGGALTRGEDVKLLDTHSDPDHGRSVYTLAGTQGALCAALVRAAAVAVERIDLRRQHGSHPRVGALDVAPLVYLRAEHRGAACAEALTVAEALASQLDLPVFLYGELTGERRVSRADLRRGGPELLQQRLDAGELAPEFGPSRLHPSAGAVLVAARAPLVAFNFELAAPATVEDARRIAALIREGGAEGLAGVRAIGLALPARSGIAQVSTNVEDHTTTSLAAVADAIGRHARVARAELVGLAPAAAFDGFPPEIPVANRRYLEDVL